MTGQLRHRLLIYTVVEHSGYEIVTESVEMKLSGKSVLIIEPTEVSGKSIGVHQFTALICEHIITHLKTSFLRLIHFAVAVAAKNGGHLLADINRPSLAVLGRPLYHASPRDRAARAADRQDALIAVHDEVVPL